MRSFVKINSSPFCAITLSFTDIGKSCPSEFITSQILLLTLFAKIKFSRKFLNLQFKPRKPVIGMFATRLGSHQPARVHN